MPDADHQRRIAELQQLIENEEDARLSDAKAKQRGEMDLATLELRERERQKRIAAYEQQLAALQNMPVSGAMGAGIRFDKYILDEIIAEGGNGQVWRGREKLPDEQYRLVAIKVLKPGISADPRRVDRFKKEISAARRLTHPHILRALDYGEFNGQFYVVMDYIAGASLREQLNGRPLPTELVIGWLAQLVGALTEAHAHKLIHRDIKPENILVQRRGSSEHLYLSDFGLVYSSDVEQPITEEGDIVGTGRYMSPEQCDPSVSEVTPRSDIYALGIMTYEMLTGTLPFTGLNKVALCRQHLEKPLPNHAALLPALFRILEKATAKNPDERYATVEDFLQDLHGWQRDPANLAPVIHAYMDNLARRISQEAVDKFVELAGDEQTLRAEVAQKLAQSFDPLAGVNDYDIFGILAAPVMADHVDAHTQSRQYVPKVHERLMQLERVVLVGEPGAGKTWMLLRVLLAYSALYQAQPETASIPIFVPLNAYRGDVPFADFVRQRAGALGSHLEKLARQGRVVLLCDALNEMPKQYIEEVRTYLEKHPRFVVSCRVRDYRDELNKPELHPLEQIVLREMELDAIEDFIRRRLDATKAAALWEKMGGDVNLQTFWRRVTQKTEQVHFWESNTKWRDLEIYGVPDKWYEMHRGARLIPLARNPFMAQMICGIYEREGVIEPNRAALFGRFVTNLLEREQKNAAQQGLPFPPIDAIEMALVALARALQKVKRTVTSEADAIQALTSDLSPDEHRVIKDGGGAETLLKAATDANILMLDGAGLKFAHQLLQEYFAAKILLAALDNTESPAQFFGAAWWDAGVWRETTVILGEFLGGVDGANRVAQWLAPVSPEVALQVITRNGAGLTLADVTETTKMLLIDSANARITETNPIGRAAAYRVLGLLDADNRFGVGVIALTPKSPLPQGEGTLILPEIDWVLIPAGKFQYGHKDEIDNPPRIVNLPAFEISRYPITYAQFQTFIDDPQGYHDSRNRWFAGLAADADDRQLREQWFKYANHPREMVNWYQAIAFCRWLSWRLGGGYDLNKIEKWAVRLPTEYEWEKAARGTDGRIYPYGNPFDANKGNAAETGIGQTSAAGIFPDGASPYGVLDMSGNVWEWCLSAYNAPKEQAADEDTSTNVRRVVRGGYWVSYDISARAVYPSFNDPDARSSLIGFRLCRPPSLII